MADCRRGRGNLYKHEYLLTDEQRVALGTDRFFTVKETAALLGVSEQAIRNAIDRGALVAHRVPKDGKEPRPRIKGYRVIAWRDQKAGLSDGREEDYERVG
jgi:excisionase family DNA binding protein